MLPRRDDIVLIYGADRGQAAICTAERVYQIYKDAVEYDGASIELVDKAYRAVVMLFERLPYEDNKARSLQEFGLLRKLLNKIDARIIAPFQMGSVFEQDAEVNDGFGGQWALQDLRIHWLCTKLAHKNLWGNVGRIIETVAERKRYRIWAHPERLPSKYGPGIRKEETELVMPLWEAWEVAVNRPLSGIKPSNEPKSPDTTLDMMPEGF